MNPDTKPNASISDAHSRPRLARSHRSRAWWVAGVYALFATLWILFSDIALSALVPTPDLLVKTSLYKGLGFVIVTSLLLALLMRRAFGALEDANKTLKLRISERIEAENALKLSEQRLRSTMDCILEGCQLLDFGWRYLYLNDAAAVHNRRPNSDLLGQRMQDSWPGIDQTRVFDQIRRCMEERIPFHEETEFNFPDGMTGWFAVSAQPVPEGVLILSIDVTERHKAETALRELNEALEGKVSERTEELRAALVRAEAADRLKSAFLATMSHELRTPLNSIIGFSGILLQGLAGELNAEQSKQLGMVRSSARHLLDLINDVLDLSKIEAGQLEIRSSSFIIEDSLERALEIVKPLAEAKGLRLDREIKSDLGEMIGDQRRVEQILLNLLNNAIKFTDSGGVSLRAHRVHDSLSESDEAFVKAVRIDVIDTGIGMRLEDQGSLFQPFRQIDCGLTRTHEGTGLGLAICRRLADLMHGDIEAFSEWGKGSRFTVTLPIIPPHI